MSYETALTVQRLKSLGRKQGFLTYAQLNEQLPDSIADPRELDKIASIIDQLERYGIRIVENAPEN